MLITAYFKKNANIVLGNSTNFLFSEASASDSFGGASGDGTAGDFGNAVAKFNTAVSGNYDGTASVGTFFRILSSASQKWSFSVATAIIIPIELNFSLTGVLEKDGPEVDTAEFSGEFRIENNNGFNEGSLLSTEDGGSIMFDYDPSFDYTMFVRSISELSFNDIGAFPAANSSGNISSQFRVTLTPVPIPAPVPIPGAVWLFASALLGLFVVARSKSSET